MIEHTCDVVEVKLETHPNADSLSLVMVGDFQVVVRTADWQNGDLGIYIEPDTIVPKTKEFEFLGEHRRIRARRLRGEWSVGLLLPAPADAKVGDDYFAKLGLEHYEPIVKGHFSTGGENISAPPGIFPKYDVLNFRRYSDCFDDGEEVILSEKIHGASCRFVCIDDVVYCGSHNHWKHEDPNNLWWKVLNQNIALESWLRHHQGLAVYGEVYGNVQKFKYGVNDGGIRFAAFDVMKDGQWLDFDEAHTIGAPLPWVPLVHRGKYDKDMVLSFAEGESLISDANHIREGIVIKPVKERINRKIGRMQLKAVSNAYLAKS
jgi:RNA ligase (TIGR02306 family)